MANSDELQRSLAERLVDELALRGIPGAAAALSWQGRELAATSGVSSTRTRLPVNDETLFRVGSVTKVLLATAVMSLVQDGKLALGDPIRQHLPEFSLKDAGAGDAVTVGDLLTHRGGWQGDFIDYTGENDDALALHVKNMRDLEQIVAPGTDFAYSNTGYCVLGRLIEQLAGEPFEWALRHLALEPFGISDVRFSAVETITGWFAVGHSAGEEGVSVMDAWELPRCARPAGGMIATAGSLARFASAFIVEGGNLSAETRELMCTPQVDAVGTENLGDKFGLGWFVREIDGTRVISHGGDVLGQHALMLAVPDASFAITVTANADGGDILCESISRWALREYLGIEQPRFKPTSENVESITAEVIGTYQSSLSNVDVARADDGTLRVTLEPRPLAPGWPTFGPTRSSTARVIDDDVLMMCDGSLAGSRARVVRGDDARIAFLRIEGRLAVKAAMTPAAGHYAGAPAARA